MADTPDPHASLWARLGRHERSRTLQWRVVHWGFWSSFVFLGLMILNLVVPGLFARIYMWIGLIYITFQIVEIASRNPLRTEALFGNVCAACPAIFSLIVEVLIWDVGSARAIAARPALHFWFWCAWICFAVGLWLSYAILQTPYRRDESRAPRT